MYRRERLSGMLKLIIAVAIAACVQADYRIINGKKVTIENYPYQVSVLCSWEQIGGGAIVSPKHVLTAAHLKTGTDSVYKFKVRVGSPHYHMLGVLHTVQSFDTYVTPSENEVPVGDLGVITLHDPIKFNERAQPIAIVAEGQEPKHGEMLTATGWGGTEYGVDSVELRMARLPCIDRKICNDAWKRKSNGLVDLGRDTLCAGGGARSSFTGDSGGPLVNDKRELVGIVSWGKYKRDTMGYPGVYVNLADPDVQKYVYSRLNATR